LTASHSILFKVFKYSLYAFLAFNVYVFFAEEHAASFVQFPNGVSLDEITVAYVATIDTAAWVILLLMFELETHILEDHHFSKAVTWTLQGTRAICYIFIVSAFVDYAHSLVFVQAVTPLAGVTDLCSLTSQDWSFAIDLDEYEAITAANCDSLSSASSFVQFNNLQAVVDQAGHAVVVGLAWVDVINAGTWLLIVLLLEIDVRLQEHDRLHGNALRISTSTKYLLYSILALALIYWGINGDFVDSWDAFLWLLAFFFIELNVVEWRQESEALGENLQ
jgi:hypothetical protein